MSAIVIGAGVVGAAVAAQLALTGREVTVLDRLPRIGGETTQRSSGVIHAGLNAPLGWWKTKLCVEGNRLLYAWAEKYQVPHARCGKLIVAQDEPQEKALEKLLLHGRNAGVEELRLIGGPELSRIEPEVRGVAALFSGTSGIVDAHELTASLIAAAKERGAEIITAAEVLAAEPGWKLSTTRGEIEAEIVINSAGLYADKVATLAGIPTYRLHPCRGDYYKIRRKLRVNRLVYPVKTPGSPGLGVHLTLDLGGNYRLGPDANYVESSADYSPPAVDKAEVFAVAARKFLPGISAEDLTYESSGLRPKLRAPHEAEEKDFVIAEDVPGWINLIGIESPGLTASLAIAGEVARRLD